jgi:[protein-PII] uridylyltransferase
MERESSSSSPSETTNLVQVLDEHRAHIAQRVMAGASGAETLAAMTEFVDGLIVGRYRDAGRR